MRGYEKDRPLKTLEAEQNDRHQHATRGEQKFKPPSNDESLLQWYRELYLVTQNVEIEKKSIPFANKGKNYTQP